MKILNWISLSIAVIALAAAGYNWYTTPKLGYIDSGMLLQQYEGAQAARDSLNKEIEKWSTNVKTLENELTQMNQEFINESPKWSRGKLAQKKKELEKKQQDYFRYSRAVNEKAQKREQELMQPIYNELNVYIKEYGKENGYDIIWGTLQGGNILYAEDAKNLTEPFLEYVKEK